MEVVIYRACGNGEARGVEAKIATSLDELDAAIKDGWVTSEEVARATAAVVESDPAIVDGPVDEGHVDATKPRKAAKKK